MAAGQLRDRVTFKREQQTPDGAGGYELTWAPIANLSAIPADYKPQRGKEILEAGGLEASMRGILKVRSNTNTRGVGENDHAEINGDPFQIRQINNPDRRNRYLEMLVERGVAV